MLNYAPGRFPGGQGLPTLPFDQPKASTHDCRRRVRSPVPNEDIPLNRLWLALKTFWRVLTEADFAARVEPLFSSEPTGPDLRILAVLQRDGRLVDFLQEDIDAYADSQIGAAVRDIHRGCRKSLHDYLTIEPVINAAEEAPVQVPTDFDPAAIRLIGNVDGKPPVPWSAQAPRLARPIGASAGSSGRP